MLVIFRSVCLWLLTAAFSNLSRSPPDPRFGLSCPLALSLLSNSLLWLSSLQMDVVYTFQTGQAAVPGALRRQPSVVSQHNDATAAKTLSSPTHVGLSSSSSLTNSAGAPPPAAASSSTAGSESVTGGQLTPRLTSWTQFQPHNTLKPAHRRLHVLISPVLSYWLQFFTVWHFISVIYWLFYITVFQNSQNETQTLSLQQLQTLTNWA